MACGILVPRPGIEPTPPAVEGQSLNHWTTRGVPRPVEVLRVCMFENLILPKTMITVVGYRILGWTLIPLYSFEGINALSSENVNVTANRFKAIILSGFLHVIYISL